jgi:hypothetical protein
VLNTGTAQQLITARCFVAFFGRGWVGRSDDRSVIACGPVERLELAVRDPDQLREQLIQRVEILLAEDLPPHVAQAVQGGRFDDAVPVPRLQVHGGAPGHVARERPAGQPRGEELVCERGQDHVDDGRFERVANEPSAQRAGRVLADAVGLHARLLEQSPVDRELPLDRVAGLGELDVVFDRPAFGVLAVERLVERDPEAAQHRTPPEPARDDLLARAEEGVGVEVDRPGVDLDVPGV